MQVRLKGIIRYSIDDICAGEVGEYEVPDDTFRNEIPDVAFYWRGGRNWVSLANLIPQEHVGCKLAYPDRRYVAVENEGSFRISQIKGLTRTGEFRCAHYALFESPGELMYYARDVIGLQPSQIRVVCLNVK